MTQDQDRKYMLRALKLAKKGRGFTSPNPLVGCVLVKEGEIIAEGYHEMFGAAHAEAAALELAGSKAKGATAYITLEPCAQTYPEKKTPPCAPSLIESGIARAVVAIADPNPKVAGQGSAMLREAGIEVEVGVMEQEARLLNNPYFSLVQRKRPYVTAKWAMTLDGKIATRKGDSRWISGEDSRELVHKERGACDAVMVGIGTVLADDPLLTARGGDYRQPTRVVIDPRLAIPAKSKLIQSVDEAPLLVYTSKYADSESRKRMDKLGIEVKVVAADSTEHLSWSEVVYDLGNRNISSLLIEGGGGLLATAFESKVVDRVMVFVAPLIIGGVKAVSPVGGAGVPSIAQGVMLNELRTHVVGEDVLILAEAAYPEPENDPTKSGIWRGYQDLDPPGG